jgi:serine/threonine protein kinase
MGQPPASTAPAPPISYPPPSPVYAPPSYNQSYDTGMLPPTSVVNNRYTILQKAGSGGMGAVYKAIDTHLNRVCALKEMSFSVAGTSITEKQININNFLQEAEILAKLDHRYIPKVYDHFKYQERYYIAMSFVEGQTLADQMNINNQPLTEGVVKSIAEQLCEVLYYLHTQPKPIIFRDLKPQNIMLQPNGQIKLIDFGIVRFYDVKKKKDTQLLGTPGFAAPEAHNGQTSPRSDIFSFGMTLYHLLTYQEPPDFIKLKTFDPSKNLTNCSTNLQQIIIKAIKPNEKDRWQSTSEMYQVLTGQILPSNFSQVPISSPLSPSIPIISPSLSPNVATPGGIRGLTKRLSQVVSKRMHEMTNPQLITISFMLVFGLGFLAWMSNNWLLTNLPFVWDKLPIYYGAGLFAYAISNRRGAIVFVHAPMQLIISYLTWPTFDVFLSLILGVASGIVMEVTLILTKNKLQPTHAYPLAGVLGLFCAMTLWMQSYGTFDSLELFGVALVGLFAYSLGEIVWGIREK